MNAFEIQFLLECGLQTSFVFHVFGQNCTLHQAMVEFRLYFPREKFIGFTEIENYEY